MRGRTDGQTEEKLRSGRTDGKTGKVQNAGRKDRRKNFKGPDGRTEIFERSENPDAFGKGLKKIRETLFWGRNSGSPIKSGRESNPEPQMSRLHALPLRYPLHDSLLLNFLLNLNVKGPDGRMDGRTEEN